MGGGGGAARFGLIDIKSCSKQDHRILHLSMFYKNKQVTDSIIPIFDEGVTLELENFRTQQ